MGIRVIVIGGAIVAITVVVLVITGFDIVQFARNGSGSEPAAVGVLVENQRLRSRNEILLQQNAGLAAENENLQARVNQLEVERAAQGNPELELVRERDAHGQTRLELAAERARAQELEDRLADLRALGARDSGNSGWFVIFVVALLAVAAVLLWREQQWRHRLSPPPMRVVGESTTIAGRPTTDVPSTRPRGG